MTWTPTRLKYVARVGYGLGQPPTLSETGIPILRATNIARGKFMSDGLIFAAKQDLPLDRAPLMRDGEILVVRSGAYTGDSAIVTSAWVGSAPGYDLRVTPVDADPRYLAYCLLSTAALDQVDLAKSRAAQPHLNAEDLGDITVRTPSLDEQRRIADFLDAETARIDSLSATRGTQVSVLDELELARIGEHLSTPESVGPVYAYFDVQLGKMLNAERASGTSQKPYLRNANVQWYEIDTEDLATMTFEPHEYLRYRLRRGDLLVCEGGYVGRSAIWDGRVETCFYQKSLHRVRARGEVPVEWLMYWLRYATATGIFEAEGNLTTIAHLTGEQLAEYRIPIPEDGYRRVTEIASEIAYIRETERKMLAANELVAERRQALITAAVTGQIDVTTAGGVAV
jgi:type I restriction enzyme, S subunit